MAKSTDCSFGGLRFDSQYLSYKPSHNNQYYQSQGIRHPLFSSVGIRHTWCVAIYAGKTAINVKHTNTRTQGREGGRQGGKEREEREKERERGERH